QCSQIRRNHNNDGALTTELGVFTVRLEKTVIWEFPAQFVTYWTQYPDGGNHYSYSVSDLNDLIREYLDTPRDELLTKEFIRDYFGLCQLLRAADRRLSIRRLEQFFAEKEPTFVRAILDARRALSARLAPQRPERNRWRGS